MAYRADKFRFGFCSTTQRGTHSCTGGHCTGHGEFFCPFPTHSPTAEVCMQQFVPDQLHLQCPPFRDSFPLIYNPGISFSIPHKVCGFVVCIIFPYTQFVNRLILFFENLHFLHEEAVLCGTAPCAFRSRVLLCLISRPVRRRTPAQIHALVTKRQNLHLIIRPECPLSNRPKSFMIQ